MNHRSVVTEAGRQHIIALTNQLAADVAAHEAKGLEAHGATVQASEYIESSQHVAAHVVLGVDTNLGRLYIPVSLDPSGV